MTSWQTLLGYFSGITAFIYQATIVGLVVAYRNPQGIGFLEREREGDR